MPLASGPGCSFDEEEVEMGIRRMSSGKAADIAGLTVELFKWGGTAVLSHLTRLLSEACSDGLPADWGEDRLSRHAFNISRGSGWFVAVCRWAQTRGLSEAEWRESTRLRELIQAQVIERLWRDPTPRLQYYLRDINPLEPYQERSYLMAALPRNLLQLVARYRLSPHSLAVYTGRWEGVDRTDRICRLCDSGRTENEFHFFLVCPYYADIRSSYGVEFDNLHDFFCLTDWTFE
ncbi:hypothetical protein R1sor_007312 [Riccia sorocarpa]|uniref:Reverse transcriptase zinc-binding domain-containing protein n=1 Tax=Riccia sorocarpa TaxID=122646 RepID=A0ABD3HRT8_9MARC